VLFRIQNDGHSKKTVIPWDNISSEIKIEALGVSNRLGFFLTRE
jgi:hypothetical protein